MNFGFEVPLERKEPFSMGYRGPLAASLSGVLLIVSYPSFDLSLLSWVALVPVLSALRERTPFQAFTLGYLTGFIFFLGLLHWIIVVTTTYGKLPLPLGCVVLVLFAAYLALYVAGALLLAQWTGLKLKTEPALLLPPFWVSLEYVRSFAITGFPWESLGYTQHEQLYLIQAADITGVYGISFLVVSVNSALFLVLDRWGGRKKLPIKEVAFVLLLFLAAGLYGFWRSGDVTRSIAHGASRIKVALIQGNIEQDVKWNPSYLTKTMETYSDLSLKASQSRPDLLIWPEAATPFHFESSKVYHGMVLDVLQRARTHLLLGSPARRTVGESTRYYNSAFLLSPSGDVVERYDKVHLVPYGEYVPLKQFFPFIDKMVEGIGDFTPGDRVKVLPLSKGNVGVLICYEIIFPDLTRQFVREGATVLVNLTNDAWFGRTGAPYQHFSMAVFRAIENRRFVARAANTGISGIIDPTGRIQSQTEIFTKEVVVDTIYALGLPTFYTRYGDIFAILCVAIGCLVVLSSLLLKKGRGV
jgi:apolipoprotein N-acyltransferase